MARRGATAHSTIPQVTPGSWEPSTFLEAGVRARATDLQEGQEWRNLKAPSKQKEKRPMQQRQQSQPVGETDLSTDVCTWGERRGRKQRHKMECLVQLETPVSDTVHRTPLLALS